MARGVYVTGVGAGGGKSAVALGLAEVLSRRVRRLGVFRPLTREGDSADPVVALLRSRYSTAGAAGPSYQHASALLGAHRMDDLVGEILEHYHQLERACDAVIVVGTDFGRTLGEGPDEPALPDELGLNLRIAGELGASVLPVVNGHGHDATELTDAVRAAYYACNDLPVLAVVANRVPESVLPLPPVGLSVPVYAIPQLPAIAAPTMAEVAAALHAVPVHGATPGALARDVVSAVVGAASVPTFLDHLRDNCLVVTPGDRPDLIVATFAAHLGGQAAVAGLLLTLGIEPDPRVVALVSRFRVELPIFTVPSDSYDTVAALTGLEGRLRADNQRKVDAALGLFESHVDTAELAGRLDLSRPDRVTPLMFEYELIERARADRRHVVLPEGLEERILRAAEALTRRGVCDLTLLGPVDQIEQKVRELGLDLGDARLVNPADSRWRNEFALEYARMRAHKGMTRDIAYDLMTNVNYFGTMMVHTGRADAMVSGAVHPTADTIRPAFEIIKTQPSVSVASSVFFMCLADHVLVYGDCAINPDPTPEQLADIAVSSAETAARFGVEPRVAMLSYSTGGSGTGAEVDKVALATKLVRERRPDLPVEGPIQYDAAVDPSVAATKLPGSEVAGRATVLIFPDLNTGNNTYKAVQRSAGAVAVGPVMQGLRKPVNDLSRGATVRDIISTVAITAIQSQVAS
ncbi:phosphate acetyltransferase [Catellatospora tritici]|uniref:phosphate acetyltransferase n=1 Tax=Catellatospora tritici TaxID=2851566 RepID=UPI001C2D0E27|nr:phosphate acetyltransferase [Catellatospora tritici]MBV1848945.1 phosphate acetyltransferase [Catellatospora tritici]